MPSRLLAVVVRGRPDADQQCGRGHAVRNDDHTGPDWRASDWPTYHRTNDRAGQGVAIASPRHLAAAWQANLDAAVYGQPQVLGNLVIAATENDSVMG